MKDAAITPFQLVAYSIPIVAIEFIIYPILAILPAFYVNISGGELASFGTALIVSRIVYSCSGPVVGYLSDRIATPWGLRKPWMVAGTMVEIVSVALLFLPPAHAGPAYFAWTSALALFGFSMIDVPYIAWGSEMTRDYQTRSRIASYRGVCAILGQLVFLALPLVPAFGGRNLLEPITIERLGLVAIVLLAVTMTIALLCGPRTQAAGTAEASDTPAWRILLHMLRSRPMWFLTGAAVFTFLPYVMQATLGLQLFASVGSASAFGIVTIAGMIASIVSMPFWIWLTKRLGKHRTWAAGLIVMLFALPAYFIVAKLFGTLAGLFATTIIATFPAAQILASLPYSIMGDVIDYDELRTQSNHSANYSAIVLLVIRLQSAIGGGIALYILAAMHFSVHAVDPNRLQPGMVIGYFVVPGIFLVLAAACTIAFPIDAKRASIVRRRLERRRTASV